MGLKVDISEFWCKFFIMTALKRIGPIAIIVCILLACEDPSSSPGEKYTQYGRPMANTPAIEDIIMYEVNLRAFSQSGDLQGVIQRLPILDSMGINVIWLMPIHPIGEINSVNSPYSVKDYRAVAAEYGTLEDLRMLTDEAHALGMAVIMDWVANHTAWDNPWIENKSWYTLDTNFEIISPPGTNWQDVADLNFYNESMRDAMIDVMKYWVLEANVDGYRCDYADGVPQDFWAEALNTLSDIPDRQLIFLAEGNRPDHYQAGFDLTYAWSFYGTMKNVFHGGASSLLFDTDVSEKLNIPHGSSILRFSTNHDESAWDATPLVLFNGKQGALAASVTTFFLGGVPLIYTGQEVGRLQTLPFFSNSPIDWNTNPDMFATYIQMLRFYSLSNAAKKGELSIYGNEDVLCFTKSLTHETLLILDNVRNETIQFSIPETLQNTEWQDVLAQDSLGLSTQVSLAPYQYFILQQISDTFLPSSR